VKAVRLIVSLAILSGIIAGCNWHKNRLKVDVSGVSVADVKIHRYDQDLFNVPTSDLKGGLEKIQSHYWFFLGTNLEDQKKLDDMKAYLESPRNKEFHKATSEKYRELLGVEKDLTNAFRHLKYYFPDARIPRVYSYISGGDYSNPVQVADSVMIIALDTYLGKDFKPYFADGLPAYKAERMNRDHIVPDCAAALISSVYPENVAPMTLLDAMVEAGKRLYLIESLIPDLPGELKFDYTLDQYNWARKNESHVWAAILENRLLYSTDGQYFRMFLSDGPCTMEFGKESPPRLGEWIGLQIVSAYMNRNNDITLASLLRENDSQRILTQSAYKPPKE
jgi:hypothetical protein